MGGVHGGPTPAVGSFATKLIPSPPGTRSCDPVSCVGASSYALLFVVNSRQKIAAYIIFCGTSPWRPSFAQGLSGLGPEVRDGKFAISNRAIDVTGTFRNAQTIEGTISAKSPEAKNCGLPKHGKWTATCGRRTPITSLIVRGRS
jgi:hypothetical protein